MEATGFIMLVLAWTAPLAVGWLLGKLFGLDREPKDR